MKKLDKIPVLLYEESFDGSWESALPYIEVPVDEEMPTALFVQEYRLTGETEPDSEGEECPIYDGYIHQYVNMSTLKDKLDGKTFDKIRVALGMLPLAQARKKGAKVLEKVYEETNTRINEINAGNEEAAAKMKSALESLMNARKGKEQ